MGTLRAAAAIGAALTLISTSASQVRADPSPGESKPWAQGVPEAKQKQATALFKEGNALLRDSFFKQAVDKYREAITYWDHPAIHYNLAIALINLDQPLEVYASLQKALKY